MNGLCYGERADIDILYKRIHNINQCRSGRLFLNRSGHSRKGNQQDKCPVYVRQKPCFNVCRSHSYMQKCTHYFIRDRKSVV